MHNTKKDRAILTFLMVGALLCAAMLALGDIWNYWQSREKQEQVQSLYTPTGFLPELFPTALAEETENADLNLFAVPEPPEIQKDFQKLCEANVDTAGWLTAGEDISYPIVKRDNEYYLDHDFYGKHDSNGTLFLNEATSIWPMNQVMVIHGHCMRGRAMFGELRRYKDESYVRKFPTVTFRTIYEENTSYYAPFAAFDASALETDPWYFNFLQTDFAREEDAQAYLNSIEAKSYWHTQLDVQPTDQILVLVTCSYIQNNGRFALFCRRLRDDEKPEDVYAIISGSPWIPEETKK